MLAALLSLFGAVVGGIITAWYMYAQDQRKLRAEVALDVVSYCDAVYHSLQTIHAHKDHVYKGPGGGIAMEEPGDYLDASKLLTVLLKTSAPKAKLRIAHGEGDAVADLIKLTEEFHGVAGILRTSTRAAWPEENKALFERFSTVIDPLRSRLEERLLSNVGPVSIWRLLRGR